MNSPDKSLPFVISAFLALTTLILFWPVVSHDFVNYDDPLYVTGNSHVKSGLRWENVTWAFDRIVGNKTYWHPITWLSHQLDCQLFGVKASAHHFTNLLLHVINTVVLFLLLLRLTCCGQNSIGNPQSEKGKSLLPVPTSRQHFLWCSAFVAAFFAWHPLQVDTVAWVAERKNLLGALFALLTIWAYAQYATLKARRAGWYWTSLFLFALGLMSKGPLLVTLPCVLLLLDVWPLGRVFDVQCPVSNPAERPTEYGKLNTKYLLCLFLEKLPFFVLTIVSSAITLIAHQRLNLVVGGEVLSPFDRFMNAFSGYLRYLEHIFWPGKLAVFYPPHQMPTWFQWTALIVVLGISIMAFWSIKKRPFIFTGWFLFFGMLVPFAGFIQAGMQSIADRFVYLPLIGFFIALVWTVAKFGKNRFIQTATVFSGVAALIGCFITTRIQLAHWKNTETLFAHAAAVTPYNVIAHINLASALVEKGDLEGGIKNYRKAIEINSQSIEAHQLLAKALDQKGEIEKAGQHLVAAIEIDPNNAHAHNDLGVLLMKIERLDDALEHFQLAAKLIPDFPEAYYNAGVALSQQKKTDEAIAQYLLALKLKPDYPDAQNNLAATLADAGRFVEASAQLEKVVASRPQDAEAHFNLSYVLRKLGKTDKAQQHYETALKLDPNLLKK